MGIAFRDCLTRVAGDKLIADTSVRLADLLNEKIPSAPAFATLIETLQKAKLATLEPGEKLKDHGLLERGFFPSTYQQYA